MKKKENGFVAAMYVCARSKVKGQKNIFCIFYFRVLCRKNRVLVGFKGHGSNLRNDEYRN